MLSSTTWRFVHVNDHHLGTRRSYGACATVVGGDLIHEGATHAFEYQNARADLVPPLAPDPWLTAGRKSEQ